MGMFNCPGGEKKTQAEEILIMKCHLRRQRQHIFILTGHRQTHHKLMTASMDILTFMTFMSFAESYDIVINLLILDTIF